MLRILHTSNLPILEKAVAGETPLHLSASWPNGIHLLLELGGETTRTVIDAEDSHDDAPIHYALRLGQLKSVQLLLDAGSKISLENTRNTEESESLGYPTAQSDQVICLLQIAERSSHHLLIRDFRYTKHGMWTLTKHVCFKKKPMKSSRLYRSS